MDAARFQSELDARRDRAAAVFSGAGRSALQDVARIIAAAHVDALDYIEQAPVSVMIACAVCGGRIKPTGAVSLAWQVKRRIIRRILALCIKKPKLRAFMDQLWATEESSGMPLSPRSPPGLYQLRKLKGRCLRQNYFPAIEALAQIDSSTLAQLIPGTNQEQWLRAINSWLHQIRRRLQHRTLPVEWVAFMARLAVHYRAAWEGEHIADYMANSPINVSWSLKRFAAELKKWEDGQRAMLKAASVDYAPLSNEPVLCEEYWFVPLRSPFDLADEGQRMSHCVANYWPDVASGLSRIFSVRNSEGESVATVEFTPPLTAATQFRWNSIIRTSQAGWQMAQLRGYDNNGVDPTVRKAVFAFWSKFIVPLKRSALRGGV